MKRIAVLPAALILVLLPTTLQAQSMQIDLGGGNGAGMTSRLFQLTALVTVLSLAPSLLVMMTAFTRIMIALSLLRSALGTPGTPPNTVLIGLGLFLTFFVMQPTFEKAWSSGIQPMAAGKVTELDGLRESAAPFHDFMIANTRDTDMRFFLDLGHMQAPEQAQDVPWRALIPAFMIGEMRRGFEIGFLLFLPFLVIDLVVASVLMSLGMMMLPPNVVSLPLKLVFFVTIDGWRLVSGALVQGFKAL